MGPKLSNAVSLFIDGVRDGHLTAALDKYVGDHLTQHSPGVPDDRAGLAAEFAPLLRHGRRMIRPLRGFEDGSRVFLHSVTMFGWRELEQVRVDIFDTDDDDHLIEHWGVAAPLNSSSRSGYSQVDGPLWAEDIGRTAENKGIVEAYVRECLIDGSRPHADGYLSDDRYVDHDPDAPDCGAPHYMRLSQLVGCGNFVATYCEYDTGDQTAHAGADLFRISDGRISEHWDVREPAIGGLDDAA